MVDEELHYSDQFIAFLEIMWGEGYLSPGGPEEVARLLDGIDLAGKSVVDIGSGAGGITMSLVRDHGAAKVIGIDVEAPVCVRARRLAAEAGLEDRIDIRLVEPGPVPLTDASQDIVFSRDAIVHIPDKEALARDIFRLLRPGGWFVASDWLISHDDAPSLEMAYYLEKEDLGFSMASPRRYRKALEDAGFVNVTFRNRNRWFLGCARDELARLLGPQRPKFEAAIGAEQMFKMIEAWEAIIPVLESGEHCPHNFRGRKP
jgi:phosphoethanolamine N-methyltransferase